MTWIRLDTAFPQHELIGLLATDLGIDLDRAAMSLIRLWCRMAELAPDGRIDGVPDLTLEEWVVWRGRRGRFAAALRKRCQDEDGQLRGWWRQEKLLQHQERKRKRPGPTVRRKSGDESGESPAPDSQRIRRRKTGGPDAGTLTKTELPSTTTARARDALPEDYRDDFDRLIRSANAPESVAREVLTLSAGKAMVAEGATPEDVGRGIRDLLLNGAPPAKLGRYVRVVRDSRTTPLPPARPRPDDEDEFARAGRRIDERRARA